MYGWEIFYDAPKSLINDLKSTECKALRIAMGLPRSTPQALVYREAGILPIDEEIKKRSALYSFRCFTVPNSVTKSDLVTQEGSLVFQDREFVSVESFTADLLDRAGIAVHDVAPKAMHKVPPWLLGKQTVETDLAGITKAENTFESGAKANLTLASTYNEHIKIYTDGSKGEEGVGAAFVIPQLGCERRFQLPQVSIFTAEIFAIVMALYFIEQNGHKNWVICSDSKSALLAIERDSLSSREDLVRCAAKSLSDTKKQGKGVVLQWVPAHVGIPGNERADRAAKKASKGLNAAVVDLLPSYEDIKSQIIKAAWQLRKDTFIEQYRDKELVIKDLPNKGRLDLPPVHTTIAQLIHRIRCNHWKCKYTKRLCICGNQICFKHILFECSKLKDHFGPLIVKCKDSGMALSLPSIFGGQNGWEHAIFASQLIIDSLMGPHL
jgi:ribonuclease HI